MKQFNRKTDRNFHGINFIQSELTKLHITEPSRNKMYTIVHLQWVITQTSISKLQVLKRLHIHGIAYCGLLLLPPPRPCLQGRLLANIGTVIPDPSAPNPDPGFQPILWSIRLPMLLSGIGSALPPTTSRKPQVQMD